MFFDDRTFFIDDLAHLDSIVFELFTKQAIFGQHRFLQQKYTLISNIAKTDYKVKYANILKKYESIKKDGFPITKLSELTKSDDYSDYFSSVYSGELTLSHSLNPSFYELMKGNGGTSRSVAYLGGMFISLDSFPFLDDRQFSLTDMYILSDSNKLDPIYDDEYAISLHPDFYDKLSILAGKDNPLGETCYIIKTTGQDVDGGTVDVLPLKIVGRSKSSSIINKKTLDKLISMQLNKIGKLVPIYDSNALCTVQKAVDKGLNVWTIDNLVFSSITKTLDVFKNLFIAIEVIVSILLIGWVLLSSLMNVKNPNIK